MGDPAEIAGRVLESFAYPAPCMVGAKTRIVSTVRPEIRTFGDLVAVVYRDELLVYPKSVFEEAVARFREYGRLILAGVPGTGKSQLAKILALLDGRAYEIITPDRILSKWVGESEKQLRQLLDEASSTGKVLIFDEGDWLLSARRLSETGTESGTLSIERNLINIMLTKLQEDRSIRVIVTTNMPSEYFDPALLRAGRLGEPLYIPPPTPDAVRLYARLIGAEERAEEAVKLLNVTLSFSDIVLFLKRGVKPSGVKRQRGFTVIYSPYKSKELVYKAVIRESPPVAMLVAAVMMPGPTIVLEDLRYLDDAIAVAQQINGTVYVYAAASIDVYQKLLMARVPTAITLTPIKDETLETLTLSRMHPSDRVLAAKLLEELWGCKPSGSTAEELRRTAIRCYTHHA